MQRRSDAKLSTQALFSEVCDSRVDWPGKTVRLERNSVLDHRHRPTSVHLSVAELYHENTKLYPNMLGELLATRVDVDDFRQEFIRRRAALVGERPSEPSVDDACRGLLRAISSALRPELFYALELRVAANDLLATHEPKTDTLQVVKYLSPDDLATLRNALQLTMTLDAPAQSPMLFLVACFSRNDILFGPRGYRRSLLEAGQVTAGLLAEAERIDLPAVPIFEFTDRDVDAVMEADGIEEGTVVAFALGEVVHAK